MERHNYDKLYARIDKIFAGTPNTPSALAAKTEILENLTAKYDDLLSMGLSEEDAINQVVDSIGDIGELFGTSDGTGEGEEPSSVATSAPKPRQQYAPEKVNQGKLVQKSLIAIAVALYILSILCPILSELGGSDEFYIAAMFGIWGIATAMIVGSGFRLPWNNPKGKILLALGVGGYIWAFVPMFLLSTVNAGLAISAMFGGWAIATLLIIFSTNFKRKGLPTSDGRQIVVEPARTDKLPPDVEGVYKPISTILTIVTLLIYLGVSFATAGWIYTWLIWVIHGCVCDIVKAICWLIFKSRRDSE